MKILFFVFYFLTTFGLNAQIDIPLEKSYKIKKMQKYIKVKSEMFHFRVYGETWFSTIDDLVDIAEIPSTSDDNPLYITPIFPDSTILLYDFATNEVYHNWLHGMAEIINPSMTPSQWVGQSSDILIDSIVIPSLYTRNTHDSIVDTLFVDYLKHQSSLYYLGELNYIGEVEMGNFPYQMLYKSNPSTNKLDSEQIFRTDTVLLTTQDTSGWPIIDVNDSVYSTERYGVYIRFQPGYEWDLNDTLKNFNQFNLLVREQVKGQKPRQIWPLYSGFTTYILPKDIRYNIESGYDFLIPGNIQSDDYQFEHLWIYYKLTSNVLRTNYLSDNIQFKLYPNPANNFLTIRFKNTKSESLEIIITDVSGREVFRDIVYSVSKVIDFYTLNTSNLKPGFYSVNFGGLSSKFLVK